MKTEIRKEAIKFRKQGFSYQEISSRLPVSKSTCSLWLKDVDLSNKAKHRLEKRGWDGRRKGQLGNHNRALLRDEAIKKQVQSEISMLDLNKVWIKLLCAMLYWGEGAKGQHRVIFTNSDPIMIRLFLKFFRQSFTLDESRFQASLHLHEYHNQEMQKFFWADVTNIPIQKISIYKKPNTGLVKRKGYPGCISIRYNDVSIGHTLEGLYKEFGSKYGGVG